MKQLFR